MKAVTKQVLLGVLLITGAAQAAEPSGEALYQRKCSACHQRDGQGLPHPIPPLAGSPILLGDENDLARLVLHGKDGMPAFHLYLKDDIIAAILSYARGAWGNAAPPVAPSVVADERAKLGDDGFVIASH